jgi:hypothetical protein
MVYGHFHSAPSTAAIDPNRLYFTAGPNNETDGLFGYIIKISFTGIL